MSERFEHAGSIKSMILPPRAESCVIGGRVVSVGGWIDAAQCEEDIRNEIVGEIIAYGSRAFDSIEVAHCYRRQGVSFWFDAHEACVVPKQRITMKLFE